MNLPASWLRGVARPGDLPTLTAGQAVESALRLVAFIVWSQALGPAAVGMFASVVAMTHLMTQLSQLGIDTSVISLASKELPSNPQRAHELCRAGFNLQLWISVCVLGLAAIASPLLAS